MGRAVALAATQSPIYGQIRVVDSCIPDLSYFTSQQTEAFGQIEVLQLNLEQESIPMDEVEADSEVDQAFERAGGEGWDVIVNAMFESRYGCEENFLYMRTELPAKNIVKGILKWGCGVVIQMTPAASFEWNKKMGIVGDDVLHKAREKSPRSVAIVRAECTFRGEESLPLVVLHLGDCYGAGFFAGTDHTLIGCRVHLETDTPVAKCPWDDSDKLSTVHTTDAARAALHAGAWYLSHGKGGVHTFNVVDDTDSSRLLSLQIAGEILGVKIEVFSSLIRAGITFASRFETTINMVNKSVTDLWIPLLAKKGIVNTPLECTISRESFGIPWGIRLDGRGFKEATGFVYWYPQYDRDSVNDCLDYWKGLGVWP